MVRFTVAWRKTGNYTDTESTGPGHNAEGKRGTVDKPFYFCTFLQEVKGETRKAGL